MVKNEVAEAVAVVNEEEQVAAALLAFVQGVFAALVRKVEDTGVQTHDEMRRQIREAISV